jgi:hypothetical protein
MPVIQVSDHDINECLPNQRHICKREVLILVVDMHFLFLRDWHTLDDVQILYIFSDTSTEGKLYL